MTGMLLRYVACKGKLSRTDIVNFVTDKSADVIVVGGGVVGLWTAYHLAQQGVKTMVLEQVGFCLRYPERGLTRYRHTYMKLHNRR